MVIGWLTGRARPGLPIRCALRNPCCILPGKEILKIAVDTFAQVVHIHT